MGLVRGRRSLLAVAGLLLLTACQGHLPQVLPRAAVSPAPGGQVTEAILGQVGPLNPLFEQETNAQDIDSLIYQGLTTVDAHQHVIGLLARSWTVSADGLSYTFALRDGVRWADGKPFTADDVMFTFGVLQSPQYQEPDAQYWKEVTVQKVGPMAVRFTLKAPSASFPVALRLGILPRHVFERIPITSMASSAYSGARAFGTGPFRVQSISPDRQTVVMVRNPYARPRPYLDRFVFRAYPTLGDAVEAVTRGQADTVGAPEMPQVDPLRKQGGLRVLEVRTYSFVAMFFDLTPDLAAYFDPPTVRQALVMAIDRRKIIDQVLGGRADPAPGPKPPPSRAKSAKDAAKYPYDPARAATLLQQAGWARNPRTGLLERNGRPFSVTLETADAYPYVQVAESISRQLRPLGVAVDVRTVPVAVLFSRDLMGRQYQMAIIALDTGPDPDEFSIWHSGAPPNTLNFASDMIPHQAIIDKDLEDGRSNLDLGARRTAYADFQDLISDGAPADFLFEPYYTYVVSTRVRGVRMNPVIDPVDRFQYVTDWYVTTNA